MTDAIVTRLSALRGTAPGRVLPEVLARTGLADRFAVRPSPLGPVFVAFGERGVSEIGLAATPEEFVAGHLHRFGRLAVPGEAPPSVAARLDRALQEGRPGSLPLDLEHLGPFRTAVLRKTAEIPRGEVRPYGWVAGEIGRAAAVRAVGSALAANPIPLLVPCHRVVRSDGRLGRYSLGEDANKRRLLEAEGIDLPVLVQLAARGMRFVASDTTSVYCYPTCRHARRISHRHRVEFRTGPAAEQAGYRPCRDCRPKQG